MRKAVDNSNIGEIINYGLPAGLYYYEYIPICVNNIIVAIQQENQVMQTINNTYNLNTDNNTGSSIWTTGHVIRGTDSKPSVS